MRNRRTAWLERIGPAVLAALLLAGCRGGEPMGKVIGLVTYEGRPVAEGRVTFHNAAKGVFIGRNLGADGRFVMQTAKGPGLPVGSYQVSINAPRLEVPFDAFPKAAPAKEYPNIPTRYRDAKTSGFTAEVQKGSNPEFHFDMRGAANPTDVEEKP